MNHASSVILDMVEGGRIAQSLKEPVAIFEVGLHVGDLRVEDVRQGTPPQEELTDHAHAFRVFVRRPHCPEPHHRGQLRLELGKFFGDALVGRCGGPADRAKESLVALHEGDNRLPVVLGDVFSLVTARTTPRVASAASAPGSFLLRFHHSRAYYHRRTLARSGVLSSKGNTPLGSEGFDGDELMRWGMRKALAVTMLVGFEAQFFKLDHFRREGQRDAKRILAFVVIPGVQAAVAHDFSSV